MYRHSNLLLSWTATLAAAVIVIFISGLFLVNPVSAQNLAFEVATVKPSPPIDLAKWAADAQAGKMPKFGPHIDASRAEYNQMSLKALIANAYKLKSYQVTGPQWIATERFDIAATIPDGVSKDDVPKLLQALLVERFKLITHRDTQEHPALALLVGKDGPKMKESPAPPAPIDENAPLKPGEMKMDGPDGPMRVTRNADGSTTMNMGAKGTMTQRMDMQSQTMRLEASSVTMEGLADMLTNLLKGAGGGNQVVDMTGLKGNYQIALEISLADLMVMAKAQAQELGVNLPMAHAGSGAADASPAAVASDPSGASTIYSSVQKLGLKLEQRKAKVEQLIVDHIEKTPTEN